MAAGEDKNYVCQLNERTAEKAKVELNEDPKDRLNAVSALRTWLQQQPHISFQASKYTGNSVNYSSRPMRRKANDRV